ncbi:MAG: rRNA pseudouridine synthase [Phycisphaerales bacterium]|nr:rRNA pseudouridine synthase [Phycisphaerales bacterium]
MPPRAASGSTSKPSAPPKGLVRLQRIMADAGVASRRACEEMIERGLVEVNGEIVDKLPSFANPRSDRIVVDGRPLQGAKTGRSGGKGGRSGVRAGTEAQRKIYIMLHKPPRTLVTMKDELSDEKGAGGRRTVADLVRHPSGVRLYPVGRLDFETEGLLIMTNDGELTNRLTHPRYGVNKSYQAVIKGVLTDAQLAALEEEVHKAERKTERRRAREQGSTITPRKLTRLKLTILKRDKERTLVEITLAENRNRQLTLLLSDAGWPVRKLTRTAIGPVRLSGVPSGAWRELERDEIRALRKAAAGALSPKKPAKPAAGAPTSSPASPSPAARPREVSTS